MCPEKISTFFDRFANGCKCKFLDANYNYNYRYNYRYRHKSKNKTISISVQLTWLGAAEILFTENFLIRVLKYDILSQMSVKEGCP